MSYWRSREGLPNVARHLKQQLCRSAGSDVATEHFGIRLWMLVMPQDFVIAASATVNSEGLKHSLAQDTATHAPPSVTTPLQ